MFLSELWKLRDLVTNWRARRNRRRSKLAPRKTFDLQRLGLESLEERRMLAYDVSFDAMTFALTLTKAAGDTAAMSISTAAVTSDITVADAGTAFTTGNTAGVLGLTVNANSIVIDRATTNITNLNFNLAAGGNNDTVTFANMNGADILAIPLLDVGGGGNDMVIVNSPVVTSGDLSITNAETIDVNSPITANRLFNTGNTNFNQNANITLGPEFNLTLGSGIYTSSVGTVLSSSGSSTLATNDAVINGTIVLSGSGSTLFLNDTDGPGIGLGTVGIGGALNISNAELQNITSGAGVTLQTGGNISVNNVTAAASENLNLVTLIGSNPASTITLGIASPSTFDALTVNTPGNIVINQDVTTDTGAMSYSGGTAITVNTSSLTSAQAMSFQNATSFMAANTALAATSLTLSGAVTGATANLTANVSGTTAFNANVSLASLASIGAGAVTINAPSVTTSGAQSYNGAVTLAQSANLVAGSLTFGNTLTGVMSDLTANVAGATAFNGNVALNSLSKIGAGGTTINAPSITTTGIQNFAGNVSLAQSTTLNAGAANVSFGGTINSAIAGAAGLTVTTSGQTNLMGNVGSTGTLANLLVNGGGTAVLGNGGAFSILTDGNLVITDDISLAANTTLQTLNGGVTDGNVVFNGFTYNVISAGTYTIGGARNYGPGGATITANGVVINAKMTSAGAFTINSTGDIDINADIDPPTITLNAAGDISIDALLQADDTITVNAGTDGTGSITMSTSGSLLQNPGMGAGSGVFLNAGATGGIALAGNITTTGLQLQMTAANGDITQTAGTILANNAMNVTTISASGMISLPSATNDFSGELRLTNATSATVTDAAGISLGTSNVGSLVLTAATGNIANVAAANVAVTGIASFTATAGNVDLGNQAGDTINFGSLSFSGNTVSVFEDSAMEFTGTSNAVNASFTAVGAITDAASTSIAITGASSFTANGGLANITLGDTQPGDALTLGTMSANGADVNVSAVSASLGTIAATNFGFTTGTMLNVAAPLMFTGNLSLQGNDVTIGAKVTAAGNISITSIGNNTNGIIVNAAIDPVMVTLTSDDDIVINAAIAATDLISITAGTDGTGNLTTNAGGTLTQMPTTGAGTGITLVAGTVNATSAGSITIGDDVTAAGDLVQLTAATDITGNDIIQSAGAIALTAGVSATGGSILIANTGGLTAGTTLGLTAFNNVTVNSTGHATTAITVNAGISGTSGNIVVNNTGGLTAGTTLNMTTTTNGDITIAGPLLAANAVTLAAGTTGTGTVALNAGGTLTQSPTTGAAAGVSITAGTTAGNVTLAANVTATGDAVQMTASAGAITQTAGAISVNSATSTSAFTALNNITLNSATNDFVGEVQLNNGAAATASITDATALAFGNSNVGALQAVAGGAITDVANVTLTVVNNASFNAGANNITLGDGLGADTINFGTLTVVGNTVGIEEDSLMTFQGASMANTSNLRGVGINNLPAAMLNVTGDAFFRGTGGTPVTLGTAAGDAMNFGRLTVQGSVVTIAEDSAMTLTGANNITTSAAFSAAGTLVNDAATVLPVVGNASFNANGGASDIQIGFAAGDAVNFGSLTFVGNNVAVNEDSATDMTGANTANAALNLQSAGAITDAPATSIAVTGNAFFNANSGTANITLGDNAADVTNFGTLTFMGAAVSIQEDSAMTLTNTSQANGAATLVATGSITDTPASSLQVIGLATITANGGGNITLGDAAGEVVLLNTATLNAANVNVTNSQDLSLVGNSAANVGTFQITTTATNNLTVPSPATVTSVGNTVLNLGGNFTFNAGATMTSGAAATIDINTNLGGGMGVITLAGTFAPAGAAGIVTVDTGNNDDIVLISRLDRQAIVTTGTGNDTIIVNSLASNPGSQANGFNPGINNGTLDTINAKLTIVPSAANGVNELNRVLLSDTASTRPNILGTLTVDNGTRGATLGGFAGSADTQDILIKFAGDAAGDVTALEVRGATSQRDALTYFADGATAIPATANSGLTLRFDAGGDAGTAQTPVSTLVKDGFRVIGSEANDNVLMNSFSAFNTPTLASNFQIQGVETLQFFGFGGDDTFVIPVAVAVGAPPAVVSAFVPTYNTALIVGGDGNDTLQGGGAVAGVGVTTDVILGGKNDPNNAPFVNAINAGGGNNNIVLSDFDIPKAQVVGGAAIAPPSKYTLVQVSPAGSTVTGTTPGDVVSATNVTLDIFTFLYVGTSPAAFVNGAVATAFNQEGFLPFIPVAPAALPNSVGGGGGAATFQQVGTTLYVTGTASNDTVNASFDAFGNLIIYFNGTGTGYSPASVNKVVYSGGGGDDEVTYTANTSLAIATLAPRSGYIANGSLQWWSQNVFKNTFLGKAGDVVIQLDSAGTDTAQFAPSASTVQGAGYTNISVGASQVFAYSSGGGDSAVFGSSAGQDVFYGLPQYSLIYGSNYLNQTIGYSTVNAYGTAAQGDVAVFFDSAGNDTFTARPTNTVQTGAGYSIAANQFAQSYGFSVFGGVDNATLYDSAGNDVFYGFFNFSMMVGNGFMLETVGYKSTMGVADAGGFDTAYFQDSVSVDQLNATGSELWLLYGSSTSAVRGFDQAYAQTSQVGTDKKSVAAIDYSLQALGDWVVV